MTDIRTAEMTEDSEQPYRIDGSGRVWLSPSAREWGRQHFGSGLAADRKMAEHVLHQENLRAAGWIQRNGEN
jgi:hypothetical protein